MNITTAKTSELRFDAQNARKHSKRNLDTIKNSLKAFGQQKPIVIRNGVVIAGNGTLAAALELGWKTIDVVSVPAEWDDDTAKAFALADNKSAELAEWDDEVLLDQLLELTESGFDIESIGFATPKDSSDSDDVPASEVFFAEKYEVIVECADEFEQESILLRLSQEGLIVRAIVV